jgi:peroxiredoxin
MPNRFPGIGEPAPWFEAHSPVNPRFQFDSVAGRYVVLCFFGSAGEPASHRILHDILEHRHRFDDDNVSFFAVSIDPEDQRCARIEETLPGLHVFWDFDLNISRLFGVADPPPADGAGAETYCRVSVVLDERLRVLAVLPFDERPEQHVPRLIKILSDLPPLTGQRCRPFLPQFLSCPASSSRNFAVH